MPRAKPNASLPGLHPQRLLSLSRAAVERCKLDLRGLVVLTEAASGAYAITPLIAALAGAERVLAYTADSRWGSAREVHAATHQLLAMGGVEEQLQVIFELDPAQVGSADIITNSGHLRPIGARLVSWMKPTAVVTLMYEAWELRPEDVDLQACYRHHIAIAGTNERHPAVDVFSYLGPMAQKLLFDAGVAVYGSQLLLLSNTPFEPYLKRSLENAGARLTIVAELPQDLPLAPDAILVAMQPRQQPVLGGAELAAFAERFPGTPLVRFWGDLPSDPPLPTWPLNNVPGHMGVLPSDLGPEPVARLQAGGLKVGEVLARGRRRGLDCKTVERAAVDEGLATLHERDLNHSETPATEAEDADR